MCDNVCPTIRLETHKFEHIETPINLLFPQPAKRDKKLTCNSTGSSNVHTVHSMPSFTFLLLAFTFIYLLLKLT